MPVYAFHCPPPCDYREEVTLQMGAASSYRCSNCGKPATRDLTAEVRGTPPARRLSDSLPTPRERPLVDRVKSGEFKLYESARETGLVD